MKTEEQRRGRRRLTLRRQLGRQRLTVLLLLISLVQLAVPSCGLYSYIARVLACTMHCAHAHVNHSVLERQLQPFSFERNRQERNGNVTVHISMRNSSGMVGTVLLASVNGVLDTKKGKGKKSSEATDRNR